MRPHFAPCKMWFFNFFLIFSLLGILLLVQGKSVMKDEPERADVEWPKQYSFEASRIFLLAGFSEEIQMWRTRNKSRVDYNNGAVKSIVLKQGKGVKYEIHPETDKSQVPTLVCQKTKGSIFNRFDLDDILPETFFFQEECGREIINDVENIKFSYEEEEETNVITKRTIWAVYKSDERVWIPTRYEVKQTNTWLGILDNHEIWEFSSFNTDVDEEAFDLKKLCKDPIPVNMNHKDVTEKLLFLNPDNDAHVEHAYRAFKKKHNRNYFVGEHEMRKTIFRKNMRLVTQTNRKNLGYKLVINQFADRTDAEMRKSKGLIARPKGKAGGTVPFPYTKLELNNAAASLPEEYDSRLDGLVTPVKNQESCGSCWTYGTTASMEGALARSTGNLINLSNQALVDCAWPYGAAGCNGGFDIAAYQWMTDFGLPSEAEYGFYTNSEGYCRIKNMTKTYPIRGFTDVTPYSAIALKTALVNHGPLSVSVNANVESFSLYSSGIFYDQECDPSILSHEVALVGYGQENGEDYWILKNSWGKEWGLDGYMHIAAKDNNCGVETEPTYVVL